MYEESKSTPVAVVEFNPALQQTLGQLVDIFLLRNRRLDLIQMYI
jgi:hypothetical protein